MPAAGATQSPEEIRVSVLVAVDDATVGQDDLRPDELVGGEPVLAAEDSEPAAERQPRDPDRRAGPAGDREAELVELLVDITEQRPSTTVARPASTDTELIRLRSIRIPRVDERPAKQCPPPRAAVSAPTRRANVIVSATSGGVAQRTTAAGRTSSYCAQAGLRTSS